MYQTLNRAQIPMYNVLFADIRTNSGIQLQWYLAPLLLELFVKIDSKRQIFSPSREFNTCDDQKFLISSPTLHFAPKRVCNVRIGTSPVLIDQIRPLEGLIGAGEPERENLFVSSSTAWFWKARAPDRNCGSALGPARLMRFFDVDYCQ